MSGNVRCKVKSKDRSPSFSLTGKKEERQVASAAFVARDGRTNPPCVALLCRRDQEKTITRTTVHFRDLDESEYNYRVLSLLWPDHFRGDMISRVPASCFDSSLSVSRAKLKDELSTFNYLLRRSRKFGENLELMVIICVVFRTTR